MIKTGIISKAEKPTNWVSNLVITDSTKTPKICLDPKPLNDAILRPHCPIHSSMHSDDLMTKLQVGKLNYSICKEIHEMKEKNGFGQFPLGNVSLCLITF
ncbi:hypothetical protein NPIL_696471 [Nephila pilipes]|uniref:Uncharacterized protein n=1 Tax=Nephila pilipes TaxID=299642 RepID=A0A8X6QZL3_NEPPI|nr:hypothetical protein NPIL_696471 [Nephila pilipes]